MVSTEKDRNSILTGTIWMLVLSILLFWLPVLGPIIAGFVGGRKSGGITPATISSIIPAILAGVLFFLIGAGLGLPVIGALVGAGVLVVIVVETIPMILAAMIGGALAVEDVDTQDDESRPS